MDTKLTVRIGVKMIAATLLIGSAVGDFLSTRLTVDDFADEPVSEQTPIQLADPRDLSTG